MVWPNLKRPRCGCGEALRHSWLVVFAPEGRFVIENAWPVLPGPRASRGVVVEGPVFAHALGRLCAFRYEVRLWKSAIIHDADWAVASPQQVTTDEAAVRRVLSLTEDVPPFVWGRRRGTGEMWNSNSVIAWLLASAGLDIRGVGPPAGGRAPGWETGIAMASKAAADAG